LGCVILLGFSLDGKQNVPVALNNYILRVALFFFSFLHFAETQEETQEETISFVFGDNMLSLNYI